MVWKAGVTCDHVGCRTFAKAIWNVHWDCVESIRTNTPGTQQKLPWISQNRDQERREGYHLLQMEIACCISRTYFRAWECYMHFIPSYIFHKWYVVFENSSILVMPYLYYIVCNLDKILKRQHARLFSNMQ